MNMVVYFAPPECDGVLKFLCGNEMNAVYDLAPLKYTRRSPQRQIFRRIDGSFTRCLRDGGQLLVLMMIMVLPKG